ncbi:MAG TPA: sugar ABC transporter substrate-binding protein [Anaerolineales bacterium]|jgi:ribose transport system substrate-binding protein|nr:sugar ABC transporter substrate-binding protein [Anaerolineales bacterium]
MSHKTLINLSIAVVLILAVLLSACQPAAAPVATEAPAPVETEAPGQGEPTTIVIGWTPPDITGVFKTATDFFQASADDANKNGFDVQLITQSVTSHTNFADQVAIIEDYIQRDVDVIAISPIEVEVIKPALAKAAEAGIPVIIVNLLEPIEGAKVDSYIGFDNSVAAEVSAYSLLDYFGGPGVLGSGETVEIAPDDYLDIAFWEGLYGGLSDEQKAEITARGAIIEGVAGGFFSTARLNGFHKVVDQYPGVEIVGNPCAADWNREKGVKCTEDFLQANPTGLDFFWAASNEMGLGAMLASEAADRLEVASESPTVGDETVAVFTNDVTPESVERIKEGKIIAETTHGFADWGWFGGEYAVMLACGETPSATYDIRPRTVYQANADQYYPDPALPPIDWAQIKADCKK